MLLTLIKSKGLPVIRHRHFCVLVLLLQFCIFLPQILKEIVITETLTLYASPTACRWSSFSAYISVRHNSALSAHDSSDLAALWSGVEVIAGALVGDPLHGAFNANLKIKIKIKIHLL